jgi:hypothetical protein
MIGHFPYPDPLTVLVGMIALAWRVATAELLGNAMRSPFQLIKLSVCTELTKGDGI